MPGVSLVISAITFAANKHRDQRRKDPAASSYINHPIALAHVLAKEGGIDDERVLIAAILHECIPATRTPSSDFYRNQPYVQSKRTFLPVGNHQPKLSHGSGVQRRGIHYRSSPPGRPKVGAGETACRPATVRRIEPRLIIVTIKAVIGAQIQFVAFAITTHR